DVYVDGKKVLMADPHINGWVHCNPVIILDEETSKLHTVRIQMSQGDEDKKFTILGFGIIM
ncbi:MAG: SGNH/GDSL hydrolase family protein, partial [Lachnospiraceae bacterium]|nr:SGNH/GDSL hydrolase family protein [Lachnospiraceae bacterium]